MTLALIYRVLAVPSGVPGAPAAPSVQYTRYPLANPSVVDLSIVATNATGADVALTDLTIELPTVDSAAGAALTTTPPPTAAAPPGWQCRPTRASYRFLPGRKHHTLAAGASLTFTFPSVTVATRTEAGTAALPVTETTAAGAATGIVNVDLDQPRCAFITDALEPAARRVGDPPSTLAWATWPGVESVTLHQWLTGPVGGLAAAAGAGDSLGTRGSTEVHPQATTNYQLIAHGADGNVPGTIHTLTVEIVTVTVTVKPSQVGLGQPFALHWRATFDRSFWHDLTFQLGDEIVTPTYDDNGAWGERQLGIEPPPASVTYSVTVSSGADVVAQDQKTVTVVSPVLPPGALTPSVDRAVPAGTPVTLTWKPPLYATAARITAVPGPDVGPVSLAGGTTQVAPVVTTAYTLEADGYGAPARAEVGVSILPISVESLTWQPTPDQTGFTVAWRTVSAASVTYTTSQRIHDGGVEGPRLPDGQATFTREPLPTGERVSFWSAVNIWFDSYDPDGDGPTLWLTVPGQAPVFPFMGSAYGSDVCATVLYDPTSFARVAPGSRVRVVSGADGTFDQLVTVRSVEPASPGSPYFHGCDRRDLRFDPPSISPAGVILAGFIDLRSAT